MSTGRAFRRSAAVLAFAAALAAAAPAAELPAWVLAGEYDERVEVGFHSAAGDYDFLFDVHNVRISLSTLDDGTLAGGGLLQIGDTFELYQVVGTSTVDETGAQHVDFDENVKFPRISFRGTMASDGGDVTGTYTRKAGFGGLPGDASGPATLRRFNPAKGQGTFRLEMTLVTDAKGRVRGLKPEGGEEAKVRLTTFGQEILPDGTARGLVKTSRDRATTTCKVKLKGSGWRGTLEGPMDAGGFHALVSLRTRKYEVSAAPWTFPVFPGPEPPPPPPPPPPKNRLALCDATVSAGQIEITRNGVPRKFFGKTSSLTVQFPASDSVSTVHADPSTATGMNARRFFVEIGNRTYGTASAPADVTLEIRRFSTIPGQVIEILCTGTVVDPASGKSKDVDVLVEAVVQ
ncbi:MAG: hypothetical protein HMLKMBBP_04006 [Planctomycetes bacterium]|nr:hypothetical protein [Planctomycetota bacterium]